MTEIQTERLVLRRATMADLSAIHAILSNASAMRYWSSLPHVDLSESETWLRSMVDAGQAESDDFIIERDGEIIGKLGCWKLPEIGFILSPDAWGHGYASEAMHAFLERRRTIADPNCLIADVDPRNEASLRLLMRHGFVETGRAARTWHIAGEWCDSVYLELKL